VVCAFAVCASMRARAHYFRRVHPVNARQGAARACHGRCGFRPGPASVRRRSTDLAFGGCDCRIVVVALQVHRMAHARADPSFPALLRRKKGLRSAGCPGRPALLARAHSPLSRRSAVAGSLGSGGGADPDHSLAWPRAGDRLTRGRTPCTLAQRSGRRRRAAPGTRSPGTLAAAE